MKQTTAFLSAAILLLFTATMAQAQTASDTLAGIKERKEVNIGFRNATIPLSFVGSDGQPQGYSVDISLHIVKKIAEALGEPDLKVNYHLMAAQNRMEMLQNGTIDFECSSTTITPERQKSVAFSKPFYVSGLTYLYDETKIPEINSPLDLKGKSVAVIKGTTGEAFLTNKNQLENIGINFIVTNDNDGALKLLEKGEVIAIFQDDVQLAGLRAMSPMAGKFVLTGRSEHLEPYGCMFRLHDPAMEKIINDSLHDYAVSGAMNDSYKKWFVFPLENLGGVNLKLPMSKGTREARDALKNG